MSKFVQKTLHSLNSVLNNSGIFYSEKDKLLSTRRLSLLTFQETIKNSENKQDEEEFITKSLNRIEKRLSEPDVSCAEIEEMVKICMVCEAMDYKAEFIYVHSLKLAQKGNFQQKHTGYLAAEFFLHPQHELVILLINTIQKDLSSSNAMEVILALTVVCHLINSETVHNVLHLVESKLQHPMPSVRKCAVLTLSHCLQLIDSESAYLMAFPKLEKCLSDPELEVVSVVIPTLHKVIKLLNGDFSYILDSLLNLHEQILMRRIPHSMIYSDIPAPWLQIEILKLIKYLCTTTENSKKLSPILKKTLSQTGSFHAVAQAIVYQVLETIAAIEADSELLEIAISSVSMLLKARDVNMKFMGLQALILIVKKAKPNITAAQQDIIIDCLKLPDESLQLKTLELMYHLANTANVQAISKKMIEFLDQIKGDNKKKDLIDKILHLAEIYKNFHEWYISVILSVIQKVNHLVTSAEIYKILAAIMQDEELKQLAKQTLIKCFSEKDCVASSLIKIYVSISSEIGDFHIILPYLEIVEEDSLSWILISLMESILKHKSVTPECVEALKKLEDKVKYSYSEDIVGTIVAEAGCVGDTPAMFEISPCRIDVMCIYMHLSEIILSQILQTIDNISDIPKMDVHAKVDPSLSCLDSYVLDFLNNSNCVYEPPSLRLSSDRTTPDFISNSFSVVSTGETSSQNYSSSFILKSPSYSTFSSPSISFQSLSSEVDAASPPVRKKAVWTKEGRSKTNSSSVEESKEKTNEDELHQLFAGVE